MQSAEMKDPSDNEILDPVTAYDRVAPVFGEISLQKKSYLQKIEERIIARIPKRTKSLFDIGAGDGQRAMRIARAAGIGQIILLEPSAKMRAGSDPSCEVLPIKAEELVKMQPALNREFDVIICLWNVMGHIRGEYRGEIFRMMARMLARNGLMFVDVNHRYNMKAYGTLKTVARMFGDTFMPSKQKGDVIVRWNISGVRCSTYGHVFREHEMEKLIAGTGLEVVEKIFVDYETGETRRSPFDGNLFYVLGRNS